MYLCLHVVSKEQISIAGIIFFTKSGVLFKFIVIKMYKIAKSEALSMNLKI